MINKEHELVTLQHEKLIEGPYQIHRNSSKSEIPKYFKRELW